MATIRTYTTIEQSRKLAEILPLESADMCYIQDLLAGCKYGEYKPYIGDLIPAYGQGKIRCWSLAALINVLPDIHLKKYTYDGITKYYATLIGIRQFNSKHYDNPVDACIEMIEKLHELNLL